MEFNQLVESLVDMVDLLPWIWSGAEGGNMKTLNATFSSTLLIDGPTDDDQFLTFRRDMIFFGLHHMARVLAIQYGDGLANNAFWLSDMYWYNLLGKVHQMQDKHNCK